MHNDEKRSNILKKTRTVNIDRFLNMFGHFSSLCMEGLKHSQGYFILVLQNLLTNLLHLSKSVFNTYVLAGEYYTCYCLSKRVICYTYSNLSCEHYALSVIRRVLGDPL